MNSESPLISAETYEKDYALSVSDPKTFWLSKIDILDWIKKPTVASESNFDMPKIQWFFDGILNACHNCVDRHAKRTPDKTAIIFEADEVGATEKITYQELFHRVCRFAGILQSLGVQSGDIVTLYLPMIPDLIVAMLACARIGAVHSVVFSGFSSQALAARLNQAQSKVLVSIPCSQRAGRNIDLHKNVSSALSEAPCVKKVLWLGQEEAKLSQLRDVQEFYFSKLEPLAQEVPCMQCKATDPLFVLYTSGSTGNPKGVIHSTGGYLVYAALTHCSIFDTNNTKYKGQDVYFCTADIGWITGHSYGVYGPLTNGSTLVLFQGVPTYPDASRFWDIIDQHKVTQFYTAPTALRSLMKAGDTFVENHSLKSLRILASVGEPIDPQTWQWFFQKVGHHKCPIMDTWWQTESGGVLICPLLNLDQKPGCAAKPFFGVSPAIVLKNPNDEKGNLCIKHSWPGQMIGILNDPDYFKQNYFINDNGKTMYVTGDGAKCDQDKDYWILGRMDDVLNVSGHRLNSAELEQAVLQNSFVAETCVVGMPHDIKGQGICVFVVLHKNVVIDHDELFQSIKKNMRTLIGPIASPDKIVVVPDLPKTRSGKIIRRMMRKIAYGQGHALGDTATLVNPECLALIKAYF